MARFRIVGVLGEGGMGVVHRAHDVLQDIDVALKRTHSTDPGARARLRDEFRRVRRMSHPSVVAPWELFDGDSAADLLDVAGGAFEVSPPFFTMPVAPGERIDVAVTRLASPSERLARVRVLLPTCLDGLAALHGRGLTHGDVKPSNLFVDGDRGTWLDFGLSKLRDETRFEVGGTPLYMAPEVMHGESLTPSADVYALGVLLYELIAGRPPFDGGIGLLQKSLGRARRLSKDAPELPADVDEIIASMLALTPSQRPSLEGVAVGFGVRAPERPVSSPSLLFGRDAQLQTLEGALAAVRGGAGVVVDVHGASGMGKSALVQEFIQRHVEDCLVLRGACDRRVTAPYDALAGALDVLVHALLLDSGLWAPVLDIESAGLASELFPTLLQLPGVAAPPTVGSREERRVRAIAGLRRLLAGLAQGPRPLLIVLDDFQWSSEDTRRLLSDVIGHDAAPGALWVVSSRVAAGELSGWRPPASCTLVDCAVGRLGDEEVRALWLAVGGEARMVEAVVEAAAGDPFLVLFFREHPPVERVSDPARLFADTVERALGGLDVLARRAVEHASVGQAALVRAALLEAAGLRPAERRLLAELEDHRWIASGDAQADEVGPYHARVADLVVEALDHAEVEQHHRRLYGALERWGAADARLHAHAAGGGMNEVAVGHALAAAAASLERYAFLDAANWCARALDGAPSADRSNILEKQAYALVCAGRSRDAAACYLRAAEAVDERDPGSRSRAIRLRTRAADHFLRCGAVEEGSALFREIFAAIGESMPSGETAAQVQGMGYRLMSLFGWKVVPAVVEVPEDVQLRLDVLLAASWSFALQFAAVADTLQLRQLRLARRYGVVENAVRGFMHEIAVESALGVTPMVRRAEAMLEELRGLAGADARLQAWGHGAEAALGWARAQWPRAVEQAEAAERSFAAHSRDSHYEVGTIRTFRFSGLWWSGRVPEMLAEVDQLREEATLLGDTLQLNTYRLGECSSLELVRDRAGRVVIDANDAAAEWDPTKASTQRYLRLHGLLRAHLYLGEPEAGWVEIEREWPVLKAGMYLTLAPTKCILELGRGGVALALAARASSTAERRRWVSEAERAATAIRGSSTWTAHRAVADLLSAGAMRNLGRTEPAIALLRRAAEGLETVDMPMHAAAARAVDPDADVAVAGRAGLLALGVVRVEPFARCLVPGWTTAG